MKDKKIKNPTEEIVRKTLDLLIERAETFQDLSEVKFAIDDYIEEGYFVKVQIQNYNDKVIKFYNDRQKDTRKKE